MVRLGATHSLKGAGGAQQRTRRGGDGIRAEFGAAAGFEHQDIGGSTEYGQRYRDQGAVADAGDQNGSECTGTDGMGDPFPDPGGGERAGGQPRTWGVRLAAPRVSATMRTCARDNDCWSASCTKRSTAARRNARVLASSIVTAFQDL